MCIGCMMTSGSPHGTLITYKSEDNHSSATVDIEIKIKISKKKVQSQMKREEQIHELLFRSLIYRRCW